MWETQQVDNAVRCSEDSNTSQTQMSSSQAYHSVQLRHKTYNPLNKKLQKEKQEKWAEPFGEAFLID